MCAFDVVDRDERHVERHRQHLGRADADQQRSDQPGRVDGPRRSRSARARRLPGAEPHRSRAATAADGAGRHLRHHAAKARVQVGLRGDDAGQDGRLFGEDCGGRLVTRGFDGQEVGAFAHRRWVPGARGMVAAVQGLRLFDHSGTCRSLQEIFRADHDTIFCMQADVVIVGGGIVGLATAYQVTRQFPGRTVLVLEKEATLAFHQTGRNSGVLHSGIYYKPGTLKAINCRAGKKAMEAFCAAEGIAHEICGKVIVAVDEADLPSLQRIYERGQANGVDCTLIEKSPAGGAGATCQRDSSHPRARDRYRRLPAGVRRLATESRRRADGCCATCAVVGVKHANDEVTVHSTAGDFTARQLVTCAGVYSDRMARLTGQEPEAKIVPFRGEYYALKPSAWKLCRNLIYPTPDPQFPFLGVHFTRMTDQSVECGPNAVLAFGREAYHFFDVNARDLFESLTYSGFLKMALKHWRMGCGEMWRSLSKQAFVRALQRMVPDIRAEDLEPAPAGIRAAVLHGTAVSWTTFSFSRPIGSLTSATHPRPPPRLLSTSAS